MSPLGILENIDSAGFPRVSGDEPAVGTESTQITLVFPARAGMSPGQTWSGAPCSSFPRVSGDEPEDRPNPSPTRTFSPRERG